jgi:vitamin B12 transporter
MSKSYRAGLAALVLLVSTHGFAATETDTLVVTATRTPQPLDDTLPPVTVIDRETIERSQATDIADLLRMHAGIDVARLGGPGQNTSLFLRGTESNHVLLLLDGVKLNPATIGAPAWQDLSPAIIERIEIVKGPRSTLYGSEAVGGVINIITRRARPGTQWEVAAGLGDFGTRGLNTGVHHRGGIWRAGINLDHTSTTGIPTFRADDHDRGHRNDTANAYVGVSLDRIDIELSHYESHGNTEYTELAYDEDFQFLQYDMDFRHATTALTVTANPYAAWSSTMRLSRGIENLDQNQVTDYAHTTRDTFEWQNDLQVGDAQLFSAGLSLTREQAEAESFGTVFDEDTGIKALYLQDDITLGRHHLLIAARHTDHDTSGRHNTWDLEYGFAITPDTRAIAAVGTAFRAPDGSDRFGYFGNPNLKPETSRNTELGLRHRIDARQQVNISLFDNRINDLIGFEFDPPGLANIDTARIRGIETEYTYTADPWRARVEAIVQSPKDRGTGEDLKRRARRALTAALEYGHAAYGVGLDLQVTGRRKDIDAIGFFDTETAGFATANLTGRYQPAPQWTLRGRIENLLDRDYEQVAGYNVPGRGLYVELQYRDSRPGGNR